LHPDVVTVVGARPQFIKCALPGRELRRAGLRELLVHTGQHYDDALSAVFFRELGIPDPDVNLGVGSGPHGRQVGEMLIRLEAVLAESRPAVVLVYGDTNSTLAGALAAGALGIPVAHVEAGLRSYNHSMQEERNRVATDHWAELLFCHNEPTRDRMEGEGIRGQIVVVGDVMRETMATLLPEATARSPLPGALGLAPGEYAVVTLHRPVNADDPAAVRNLLGWCAAAPFPVLWPAHPRVRDRVDRAVAELGPRAGRVRVTDPLGYRDMLACLARARLLLTDSGGLQKEAFFLGVPCVTLRGETEWCETVAAGWNFLAGDRASPAAIAEAAGQALRRRPAGGSPEHAAAVEAAFGPADPARRIAEALRAFLTARPPRGADPCGASS
jgi:UDP-N-acetylglucosamine 2-epimerase